MSLTQGIGTAYSVQPATKTADYSIAVTDDIVLFNPTTTFLTATLPTPNGANREVRVANVGTNVLVVAVAAGTLIGPALLYPNQIAVYQPDGTSLWLCTTPPPASGLVNVTLSSANILAMSATPVSLIPAPGAGRIILVDSISLKMVTTATQYANGGAVELRYTDGSGAKVSADIAAAVITAAAATSYTSVRGVTTSLTAVVNSPLVVTNATAAFITGTGAGVLAIAYRVLPFA